MKATLRSACLLLLAGALLAPVRGEEQDQGKEPEKSNVKDVTNYAAQKAAPKEVKKIVFIGDKRPHGPPGNHEFVAGSIYLARILNTHYPNVYAVVHAYDPKKNPFPTDLSHADAVIVGLNDGGPAAVSPAVKEAMERGAGFAALHYAVEVKKGEQGNNFLKWMGGYFETQWSVNPTWTAAIKDIPQHAITRGVKPFTIRDEWYYHMRFVDGMKGVTPILSAVPDLKTLKSGQKTTERAGNPTVYEAVAAGKPQHLAWAYERPDGGRGFGITGYHYYSNLMNDDFRTVMLNAVAWTAKLEIPPKGIPSTTPTKEGLESIRQEGLRIGK